MTRSEFIQTVSALMSLNTLNGLASIASSLKEQEGLMPIVFFGHGSPTNAIEDNEFTKGWKEIVKNIPTPSLILCISAHWETKGTWITAMDHPKTIHDFGGFPQALFEVQYPAAGSAEMAVEIQQEFKTMPVGLDHQWGLDHGTWSVLKQAYPLANIPVIQLSLDYTKDATYHYLLGKELVNLRKKGVLIMGSGNMVHSFQHMQLKGDFNTPFGHDWAIEANELFKKLIVEQDHQSLINYKQYHRTMAMSVPTPEHYLPLLYILALQGKNETTRFFNDALVGGSFSMTGVFIR
jgi:4,5-DOPA dioxygenase extradiol